MRRVTPYLWILPALAFALTWAIYPFLQMIYTSFFTWTATFVEFVWFDNYTHLFIDLRFINDVYVTLTFVLVGTSIELLLGLGLALALHREFYGRRFVVPFFYIPMMMAPIAVGLIWNLLYNVEFGPINYFLSVLGLPPQKWISSSIQALPSLIIVDIWQWTPFIMMVALAGLSSVPPEYVEAAQLDGAGTWHIFSKIYLPYIRTILFVVILIRLIDAFKIFDTILVMTFGGPGTSTEVLTFYAYNAGFRYFDIGYSSSISVIIFIIIWAISNILFRQLRKET